MTSLEEQGMKRRKSDRPLTNQMIRLKRPFPLIWGIAALCLFLCFAVVTQIQFNRINAEKFKQAEITAYENAEKAYDVAVTAHNSCIRSIQVRETYKAIFGGIENMFKTTADLPASLIPDSEVARAYQETLTADIDRYITNPVLEGLPPIAVGDCPLLPTDKPERP